MGFQFDPHSEEPDDDGFDLDGVGYLPADAPMTVDIDSDDLAPFADWSRPRWSGNHDPARAHPDLLRVGRVWWDRDPSDPYDDETVGDRMKRIVADDPEAVLTIEDIEAEAKAASVAMWWDRHEARRATTLTE